MNFKFKNYQEVKFMLQGGPVEDPAMALEGGMPAEGGAPVEGGAPQDAMLQLMEMGAQALQTQDCNLAMQFVLIVMQQLGGGAPEGGAPEGLAPVFKRGGRLSRTVPKN